MHRIQYYFTSIDDVIYRLDNQSFISPHKGNGLVLSIDDYSTSFEVPSLSPGVHNLTVKAKGIAYQPMMDYFYMASSSQISFTVSDPNSTPTPSPTASSQTSNPENNPDSPLNLPLEVIVLAIVLVVAITAAAPLLVWRRTRR